MQPYSELGEIEIDAINNLNGVFSQIKMGNRIAALKLGSSGQQLIMLDDNESITFGTGDDVTLAFDAANLELLPATDDLCAFNIGDGTTDMDFKVFLGSTSAYVLFDKGNCNVKMLLDSGTISSEEHGLGLTYTGVLSSGDSMVGGNFAVTPTGTAGQWVSGIFAKVTQGSTKAVNGYISGAEFEINNTAASPSQMHVLSLNMNNTGAKNNHSFIQFHNYGSTGVEYLLKLCESGISIATTDDAALVSTVTADPACTHQIRINVAGTLMWLMCTTDTPAN